VTSNFTTSNVNRVRGEITTAVKNVAQPMTNAGYSSSQYAIVRPGLPVADPNGSGLSATRRAGTRGVDRRLRVLEQRRELRESTMLPTIAQTVFSRPALRACRDVKDDRAGLGLQRAAGCARNTVGLLEEKGLSNWKAAGAGRQNRVGSTRSAPVSARSSAKYQIQEDIHPNTGASLRCATA